MKRITNISSIITLILISCVGKNTSEKGIKETTNIDINKVVNGKIKAKRNEIENFNLTDLESYNRIVCTRYNSKTIDKSLINFIPFSRDKILDVSPIGFKSILIDAEKKGYYCCPERNLLVTFFDKNLNSKKIFIDTISSNKVVRLFESGYQYSYLIEKSKWNKFIATQKKISCSEYFIMDFDTSKKVFYYLKENNLPFITSNTTSEKWMSFEGDFKVTISTVGKKLSENEIYKNLYDIYGDKMYRIETIGKYQMCSNGGNDCYEEYVLKIYCDKKFYDNFDTYLPKSYFDMAIGNFIVLGTKDELKKLEDFYPNK